MTLVGIQFTHVLDFVMVMPLGPQLMKALTISPREFGLLISSYNIAAALASLAGAFILDRFDRKSSLLAIYIGFTLGTVACALAYDYHVLLGARILTGAFGGLIQAILFAIIADCFDDQERGAATGTVMSAFSAASVIGVPAGLFIASDPLGPIGGIHFGWRAPFLTLAALSALITVAASRALPSLRLHMNISHSKRHQESLRSLLFERNSLVSFWMIICLMFAGFSVIPFMSAYLVANVGLRQTDIAYVFMCGGIATLATSRAVGKFADNFGKLRVFTWFAALSIIPIVMLTNLPHVPMVVALIVTTLFTVFISARAIPALAMITSSVDHARRGRFLSLTSSVQQASSGIATLLAGALMGLGPGGEITRYNIAGLIAALATLLSIFAARELYPGGRMQMK
jgi:predicted MFS family arabinose efflux permease